jgi:hypothetical protein
VSDADNQSNPPAFELPDDLDADVPLPGRILLNVLYRRFPKKAEPQLDREFYDAIDCGDLPLIDNNGNIVGRPPNGYNGKWRLNDDGIFIIHKERFTDHPLQWKTPIRRVSWRAFNRLFPPEETPVDARMKLLHLIPNDVWRYLGFVDANRGDETWTEAVIEKSARAGLGLSARRHEELRAFFAPDDKKRAGRR